MERKNKLSKKMLYIDASNIHTGGGAELLRALIATPKSYETCIIVDERFNLDETVSTNTLIERIAPTIFQRILSGWRLSFRLEGGDVLLCFGNLPPLFKSKAYVVVFIQNRLLLDGSSLQEFSMKSRIRLILERLWLKFGISRDYTYIVQTYSMANLLYERYQIKPRVLPFFRGHSTSCVESTKDSKYNFFYPASGDPHKNHFLLLDAWKILANQGLHPSLALTISPTKYPSLVKAIEALVSNQNLKIYNIGELSSDQVSNYYLLSDALIYPSRIESFGLPLLEADCLGIDIIASELDYVRDVVGPKETFDPNSALSIARAVQRYIGRSEKVLNIRRPDEFLEEILRCNCI